MNPDGMAEDIRALCQPVKWESREIDAISRPEERAKFPDFDVNNFTQVRAGHKTR